VRSVSSGFWHTCAVTSAGAAQCWGENEYGQLGIGSTTNSAVPVTVAGLSSGVVAVSAGGDHTCALTSAGAVVCWGLNYLGQLGDGSTTDSAVPVKVAGLPSSAVAISARGSHTCAVLAGGEIACWGDNGNGQLGNGATTPSAVPVPVLGVSSAIAVSAGGGYTCALTSTGAVVCWGDNGNGQLGNESTVGSLVPVEVVGY
jgi:alpha-tubulin suppressor-like RCC1 family protein